MKLKKRTRNIILIVIAAVVLLGYVQYRLTMFFDKAVKANRGLFDEYKPPTYFLSAKDSNLVSPRYRRKMEVIEVRNSTVRAPISFVRIQNLFHLAMYKIDVQRDLPLDSIIHEQGIDFGETKGELYSVYSRSGHYTFKCLTGRTKPVSKIIFAANTKLLTKKAINDSIVNYQFVSSGFSIRYGKDEPVDISIVTRREGLLGASQKMAMDLLFLKRDGAVYLLLLTADDPKASVYPGMLYDIVEGK